MRVVGGSNRPPLTRGRARHSPAAPFRMPETTHPSFAGAVQYATEQLSDNNDLATGRTIQLMAQYVREDSQTAAIARALDQAVPGYLRHGAGECEVIRGIFEWIRQHVRFATDARTAAGMAELPAAPYEIELLIRPVDLLRMTEPTGDCDDFSMLTAAMLTAVGVPYRFVTIAADPLQPDAWSHVYVEANTQHGWMPMDTSHGRYPGWEYPAPLKRRTWAPGGTLQGLGDDNGFSPYAGDWLTFGDTGSTGINYGGLINTGVNAAARIFESRYGNPPAGTYKQGADGSIYYRQQEGAGPLNFPTVGVAGSSGTMLLIGIGIFAAVLVATRR